MAEPSGAGLPSATDRVWSRAVATWDAFQSAARKRWWLWPITAAVCLLLQAWFTDIAGRVVVALNAAGIWADAVRGLVGPMGLLALLVVVLLIHAYWDTRHSVSPGIRIAAVGHVEQPGEVIARLSGRIKELEAQRQTVVVAQPTMNDAGQRLAMTEMALERAKQRIAQLEHERDRGSGSV